MKPFKFKGQRIENIRDLKFILTGLALESCEDSIEMHKDQRTIENIRRYLLKTQQDVRDFTALVSNNSELDEERSLFQHFSPFFKYIAGPQIIESAQRKKLAPDTLERASEAFSDYKNATGENLLNSYESDPRRGEYNTVVAFDRLMRTLKQRCII
jgi:hypothetical protein